MQRIGGMMFFAIVQRQVCMHCNPRRSTTSYSLSLFSLLFPLFPFSFHSPPPSSSSSRKFPNILTCFMQA